MKYIAVDFDGCLCTNEYPKIGQPNWDVINKLKEKQLQGARLILWTCREGKELVEAIEASTKWGLKYYIVNDNPQILKEQWGNNPRKLGVHEFWDDRAYNPISERRYKDLIGEWEERLKETNEFSDGYYELQNCINDLKKVIGAKN